MMGLDSRSLSAFLAQAFCSREYGGSLQSPRLRFQIFVIAVKPRFPVFGNFARAHDDGEIIDNRI